MNEKKRTVLVSDDITMRARLGVYEVAGSMILCLVCTYKVLVVERSDRLHVHLQQRQDRFQLV